ncbi:MAG: YeiH family protein [Bryobacteraceae bacterium]
MNPPPGSRPHSYVSLSEEAMLSLGSMEGVFEKPAVERHVATRAAAKPPERTLPGYVLTAAVAAVAYALHYLPFPPFRIDTGFGIRRSISASILAILVGVVARNLFTLPAPAVAVCKNVVRRMIPFTIVLTGAGLNLAQIATVGSRSLAITVACILIAMAAAYYSGRALGLWPKTSLLIGAGTAICGTSAIVAVAPLIDAEDEDVTLSVGTINLLGLLLMFAFPLAGGLLHLSDEVFGVWAGTSIHAVPQVVAAGFAFSEKAGTLATLVKLVRVTLLAPFIFVLITMYRRNRARSGAAGELEVHYARLVPNFVWGFLGVAVLHTMGLIPSVHFETAAWLFGQPREFSLAVGPLLVEAGNLMLTLAMAAMGLEVNVRLLAKVGGRVLASGAIACAALCAMSLVLIRFLL